MREARKANNFRALTQLPIEMVNAYSLLVQEVTMSNIANVKSSIVKPKIIGHFDLKQSMIQFLHANDQFMRLPYENSQ